MAFLNQHKSYKLVGILLILIISNLCNGKSYWHPAKTYFKPPTILLTYKIAKPDYCERFPGICITEKATIPRYSGLYVGGNTSFENGILSIELLNKYMDASMQSNLSKVGFIPIENEYSLPIEVCKALNAMEKTTLLKGNYPITITSIGFQIKINCR